MRRILFVDDDPDILALLKVKLKPLQEHWEMHFASGGREALMLLGNQTFDAVISDLLMPDVDGLTLLNAITKKYPKTIRFVLSGTSDKEMKLKSSQTSHEFLSKPIRIQEVVTAIQRAFNLQNLLDNETLKSLAARMTSLPSLPTVYMELVKETQSPDAKLSSIGAIISKDAGMTTKLLQLVNSAHFGLRQPVSDIGHAARMLGLDTIKSMVLSHKVFAQFEQIKSQGLSLRKLMNHSLKVGSLGRLIAKHEKVSQQIVNDTYIAGVLHDVGKLVLIKNFPKKYGSLLETAKYENDVLWNVERETFGATHAEVGAYLLGQWRLPNPVVEAVAFHHEPGKCIHDTFTPLTAIHVANILEQQLEQKTVLDQAHKIDVEYLSKLELGDMVDEWTDVCQEAFEAGEVVEL